MAPFATAKDGSDLEKEWDPAATTLKVAATSPMSNNPDSLQSLWDMAENEGLRPIFLAKVKIINVAIQKCGMGMYQWRLFISAGFGWFADNLWIQAVSILQPAVANNDNFPNIPNIRLTTLALYVGLLLGAIFWGISCDVIGRRVAWNVTLVIGGIFGAAAGASPNFATFGTLLALMAFGVGGNLPVDGALFLEFLPGSHQFILTLLSAWWAIGQMVASLISWAFLARFSCDSALVGTAGYVCDNSNNSGWRYSFYCLGGLMLFLSALRAFVLPMDESPKFLISIGRDYDAVQVVHRIAKMNGRVSTLTVADLHDAAVPYFRFDGDGDQVTTKFSTLELLKDSASNFSIGKIKALFKTRRLALSTSLIIWIYAALGFAYPLYNAFLGSYLSLRKAQVGDGSISGIYSTYTYQSASGVLGSIMASALVQWSRGGRRFAMAFFTIVAGIFLFGVTASRTTRQINALTCLSALFSNAFYGVLWSYSPEVFPTPSRGTGDALAAAASRFTGLFAPIIVVYSAASKVPNVPVFASASIFIFTGFTMCLLPIETYGVTAL